MIQVVLSFPNQVEQEIVLAAVPRVGDRIKLRNGGNDKPLRVKDVLWMESEERGAEPRVLVFVTIAERRD